MPVDYEAALELFAPGAPTLRVPLSGPPWTVTVRVDALEAWLVAQGVPEARPLALVVRARLGDVGPEVRDVLTMDAAAMVVASFGSERLHLLAALLGAFRDGEAAAMRALATITSRAVAPAARPAVALATLGATEDPERQRILDALLACRWDRGATATRLGMSRRTLYRRLEEYGLLEGSKPRGIAGQRRKREALTASRVGREAKPPTRT